MTRRKTRFKMRPEMQDEPSSYRLFFAEPAEAESEAIYVGKMQNGLASADQWYRGLARALDRVMLFPCGFPLASENEELGDGLRQMLYGRGASTYRVLYYVFPPEDTEAGIIRVMHIYPAQQGSLSQE